MRDRLIILCMLPFALVPLGAQQPECTEISAEFHTADAAQNASAGLRSFKGIFEVSFEGRSIFVRASLSENFAENFGRQMDETGKVVYTTSYDIVPPVRVPPVRREALPKISTPVTLYPKITYIYLDQMFVAFPDAPKNNNIYVGRILIDLPHSSFLRGFRAHFRYQISWSGPAPTKPVEIEPEEGTPYITDFIPEHDVTLDIPTEDIPLDDVLHVNILAFDGTPVACFTAHL